MIGKPIYGNGFRGALTYLKLGTKETAHERVEWTSTRNLPGLDPEKDYREIGRTMRATANKSSRTKKPVLHLPISWSKSDAEKLNRENMEEMTNQVIKDLGLEKHEIVIYSHNDATHKHVHILANRIHPETGKAWSTSQDYQRINKSLSRLEKEYELERVDHWGLDMERDLQRVEERMRVDELENFGPRPSDGETKQAEKEGRLPDVPFSKSQIKEVRELIGDEFGEATSWKELEDRLGKKGFNMFPKGQGAVISDGMQVAKLSQMGKGVRLKSLEENYGKSYRDWNAERMVEREETRQQEIESLLPPKPDFEAMDPNERRSQERIWEGRMKAARLREIGRAHV